MTRYTKIIMKTNSDYTIEKDQQYVIDCTLGCGELKIIEQVNKHECGVLYKKYYVIGDAIDKLAEYENAQEKKLSSRNNEALTLDQLKSRIGKPIWVEVYGNWKILGDIRQTPNKTYIDFTDYCVIEFNESKLFDDEINGTKR